MVKKVNCTICNAQILETTFKKNVGLCTPCKKKELKRQKIASGEETSTGTKLRNGCLVIILIFVALFGWWTYKLANIERIPLEDDPLYQKSVAIVKNDSRIIKLFGQPITIHSQQYFDGVTNIKAEFELQNNLYKRSNYNPTTRTYSADTLDIDVDVKTTFEGEADSETKSFNIGMPIEGPKNKFGRLYLKTNGQNGTIETLYVEVKVNGEQKIIDLLDTN